MASTNHVVYAILKFLDDQQRSPDLTPDAIESLEGQSACQRHDRNFYSSVKDVVWTPWSRSQCRPRLKIGCRASLAMG